MSPLHAAVAWLRARSPVELAALAGAAIVAGYAGWDPALWQPEVQLLLHLVAVAAVAGLALAAVRGHAMPRTAVELPLLALLAAEAAATLSAVNLGMSLRATGSMLAYGAFLPIVVIAIRHRPTWVGLFAALPVLAGSAVSLGVLLWRRIEWIAVDAPGLPPLRLPAEGTVFGSVAVPPFLIWPAWALAALIEPPALRRPIRAGLVILGVPLTLLSGSRSAWLAAAVALAVAAVPWLWRRRGALTGSVPSRTRLVVLAVAGVAVAAVGALLVLPRLTAVTSLLYRVSLWRDTLSAWSTDPLLGIGPGFMPYARQAAAPDFTFPVRQPHSHNLPLGVLGDAGLLGLAAAVAVVATLLVVAGPWRMRTATGRAAAIVLIGIGVGGLSEDLTFLPQFNLLAIALVGLALVESGTVRWAPLAPPTGGLRRTLHRAAVVAAVPAAAAVLAAMVVADAGAIAHGAGVAAAAERRWADATTLLGRAWRVDPWHPGPPAALAIAAEASGDAELARSAAEAAVRLNPGDGLAWTNLALICAERADMACASSAAREAVATAAFLDAELINAAITLDALGRQDEADHAYRRSLLSQRLTAFATTWPRPISIGRASLEEDFGALFEQNLLIARWATDEPIVPDDYADPAVRALAHATVGEMADAEAWLARAIDAEPADILAWDLRVVLAADRGEPIDEIRRIAEAVRGGAFPPRTWDPPLPTATRDIASFRAIPIDGLLVDAERLALRVPFPWALERMLPPPGG